MSVLIYTDGACLGNPGPGGWGALLVEGDKKKEISGYVPTTTNNRMELTAVIEALCFLKKPSNVTVFTDSQYVKNGITLWMKAWEKNGWRTAQGKPVKNQDLWQRLSEEARQHHVEWCWVKGHSGHLRNERADFLATQAAKKR